MAKCLAFQLFYVIDFRILKVYFFISSTNCWRDTVNSIIGPDHYFLADLFLYCPLGDLLFPLFLLTCSAWTEYTSTGFRWMESFPRMRDSSIPGELILSPWRIGYLDKPVREGRYVWVWWNNLCSCQGVLPSLEEFFQCLPIILSDSLVIPYISRSVLWM